MRKVEITSLIPSCSLSFFAFARYSLLLQRSDMGADNAAPAMDSSIQKLRSSYSLTNFMMDIQAVRELHKSSPPLAHRFYYFYLIFCCKASNRLENNVTTSRDIKPHNVLLTKDFSPVLMDFGSAAPARITPANLKEAAYLQARNDSCT